MDKKNITILCKVVDNFGDIGFVYRLARALSEEDDSLKLRLIVSDLPSFAALAPEVDASKSEQIYQGWQIYDWNAAEECKRAFTTNPPSIILECFQCGRPDWLEDILFDKDAAGDIVQIVNIDYLTAEDYADDFHLLKSGTRSPRVKKINFMPGFTDKTAGLILDRDFVKARKEAVKDKCEDSGQKPFTLVFFSYERDCSPLVKALDAFQKQRKQPVHLLLAAGKSHAPFMKAWEEGGKPFAVESLPFLPQQEWDALLCQSDWNFVRGEDSLSRACLTGVPFVWQAYIQEEDYHLVKLAALNERLRACLPGDLYSIYDAYTKAYNVGKDTSDQLLELLLQADTLKSAFTRFADNLMAKGNLAAHLLKWISSL